MNVNIDDTVMVHGYKGIVKSEYMPNMYEVWLSSGLIVVPTEEIKQACSWCKSKEAKLLDLCEDCYKLSA